MVYELARFLNRDAERIPRASLEKPLETRKLKRDRATRTTFLPTRRSDDILLGYVEEARRKEIMRGAGTRPPWYLPSSTAWTPVNTKRSRPRLSSKITAKAFGPAEHRRPIAPGKSIR